MHRAFAIDSVKRLAIVVLIMTSGKLFFVIVFFVWLSFKKEIEQPWPGQRL